MEELAKAYERKMLKDLLSSDLVLQVLKPKLIEEVQGQVSTPTSASNMLEGIYGIMQLLHEAGFVAEVIDVRRFLECYQGQITYACRSLYEKLFPLTGKAKTEDQASTEITDILNNTTPDRHSMPQRNQ